jgi:hypothetical protein
VEKYYSTGINRVTRQIASSITGIFPFSVAELLVITLSVIMLFMLVVLVIKIKKGGFLDQLLTILAYVSVLYVLFIFMWGVNYDRLSFSSVSGLKIQKSSVHELYSLCDSLIERANTLRQKVDEDNRGVMSIPGGYRSVLKRAGAGYEKISPIYPFLGGKYGPPKPVLLSVLMSYTGITGVYMPYTGEPNVNVNITDMMLPCTALHEMAHQRGFAREDEANYIAYAACSLHPDADFQYSGVMLALINSMNALAQYDFESFKVLNKKYSDGVRQDLINENEFWEKYEGIVSDVSDKVNDIYLKSNGQTDGVQSYGRMVDLLLAEYRQRNGK